MSTIAPRWMFAMMMILLTGPAMALSSVVLSSDSAPPSREGLAAFNAGHYEEVVRIADSQGTASALTLAARALNTIAYFAEKNKTARKAAKRGRDYALAAIAQNPNLVEAHVQAAVSDAIHGGRISPVRAFFKGLARRSRESLDQALSLAPLDPWALSTSGAWHLEVARAGGGMIYGADPETGYQQMMQAHRLLPGNISIAYETSLRLLAANNPDWRADGLAALDIALSTQDITSTYEQEIKRRAQKFAAAIAEGRLSEKAFIDAQS